MELYIDGQNRDENKALFDRLAAQRESIEAAFGAALLWQRLEEKRACRISYTVPGGWGDSSAWPSVIEKATDAMNKIYAALAPRLKEAEKTM